MSKLYKALAKAEEERLRDRNQALSVGASTAPELEVPTVPPGVPPQATRAPENNALNRLEEHLVALRAPTAFETEPYRSLGYLIEQLHKNAGLDVVAISSPVVGDGKTTTAINLAGVLAQSPGMRVLLLEADLRQPAIGGYLGQDHVPLRGLADLILEPTLTLLEVIRMDLPGHLAVLPAGRTIASPYEVLKSPRLGTVFEEARRHFDCIIVDTPPLIPLSDCRLIGKWVDGFLVLVAAHKTPRKLLEEALNIVEPDKRVGLIFNKDEHLGPSYYGSSAPSLNGRRGRRSKARS